MGLFAVTKDDIKHNYRRFVGSKSVRNAGYRREYDECLNKKTKLKMEVRGSVKEIRHSTRIQRHHCGKRRTLINDGEE